MVKLKIKNIVEKCEGCNQIVDKEDGLYCKSYADPSVMWKDDICIRASHVKREIASIETKINPLKASKRAARGG